MTDDHGGPVEASSAAHQAAECPTCFAPQRADNAWWRARPSDARLVGVVVSREDMPPVVSQREALARFGVPIEGFRHPSPETLESWEDRLARLFGRLRRGDVVVVATVRALGRNVGEEIRTVAELGRRGVIVKVVDHEASHLVETGIALATPELTDPDAATGPAR